MADRQSRFVYHTREEIQTKIKASIPANTKRANEKAGRSFRAFLLDRDGVSPADFENFDKATLDQRLAEYWYGARTLKGEKYTTSSLENLRHSLSRYLRSPPHNKPYDIVKDAEFRESHEAFRGALRELKDEGKGAVNHHPEILPADLQKLTASFSTGSPALLQEKVQFEIRFYFCRRGAENMHKMTKDTFEVKQSPEGERYVCQVKDELNKNHQENCKESYSGYMPEKRGSKDCPVQSYVMYLQHLHPDCESLWARPKADFSSDIWYYNRPVGTVLLGKFMKGISVKYGLSKVYTNHSIRVTSASILTRKKYSFSQIKEVTGHKSVSSLAIYQRVSDNEKMEMGKSLGNTTSHLEQPSTSTGLPRPRPEPKLTGHALQVPTTTESVPVAMHDLSPQELEDIETLLTSAPLEVVVAQPAAHSQHRPTHAQPQPQAYQATTSTSGLPSSPVSPVSSGLGLQPIDFNLSPYLRDLEVDPACELQSEQLTIQSSVVDYQGRHHHSRQMMQHTRVSPRPTGHPLFAGCTIHNLTVNINK